MEHIHLLLLLLPLWLFVYITLLIVNRAFILCLWQSPKRGILFTTYVTKSAATPTHQVLSLRVVYMALIKACKSQLAIVLRHSLLHLYCSLMRELPQLHAPGPIRDLTPSLMGLSCVKKLREFRIVGRNARLKQPETKFIGINEKNQSQRKLCQRTMKIHFSQPPGNRLTFSKDYHFRISWRFSKPGPLNITQIPRRSYRIKLMFAIHFKQSVRQGIIKCVVW